MRYRKQIVGLGIAVLFLAGSAHAYRDDGDCLSYATEVGCGNDVSGYYDGYDDSQAHPLRIAAYAIHPVGYALEWLVTRPIHALVSQPELEPIFGHRPHQWDFCCGMQEAPEPQVAPVAAPAVSQADLDAIRRAVEEAREAAEDAKRAAEEAARAAEKSTRSFEKGLRK